jgi:pseudouridine synthase
MYCGKKILKVANKQNQPGKEPGERLARFLAHAGIASRRHAEELIATGRVTVNGAVVSTQGSRVDPAHDRVSVDGKPVQARQQLAYVLLHKPMGYVSAVSDPQGRPTVLDLLPPALHQLRVYPVGRLDRDTSGLLLLTNDGDFALRLTHPRYQREKYYEALVQGQVDVRALAALRRGVSISEDDGQHFTTSPAQVRQVRREGPDTWLALTIHEGHKRQVRRMLAAVGCSVLRLVRVRVGSLTLSGVASGAWRYLTEKEVARLLH